MHCNQFLVFHYSLDSRLRWSKKGNCASNRPSMIPWHEISSNSACSVHCEVSQAWHWMKENWYEWQNPPCDHRSKKLAVKMSVEHLLQEVLLGGKYFQNCNKKFSFFSHQPGGWLWTLQLPLDGFCVPDWIHEWCQLLCSR